MLVRDILRVMGVSDEDLIIVCGYNSHRTLYCGSVEQCSVDYLDGTITNVRPIPLIASGYVFEIID